MTNIWKHKLAAYEKLMSIGPQKWAKSMCPIKRYNFHMSYATESFNSRLLWARRLPMCYLIEAIRHTIEKWFDERRQEAQECEGPLLPEALRKINFSKRRAHTYNVAYIDEGNYRVDTGRFTYMVDLQV